MSNDYRITKIIPHQGDSIFYEGSFDLCMMNLVGLARYHPEHKWLEGKQLIRDSILILRVTTNGVNIYYHLSESHNDAKTGESS